MSVRFRESPRITGPRRDGLLQSGDAVDVRLSELFAPAENSYNRDYLAETPEGEQRPMLGVFHRDGEAIRPSFGSELFYAPLDRGQEMRHVGTLEPLWNLFDLAPEGSPAWDEQLNYE